MAILHPNPNSGLFTGFRSVALSQRQDGAVPLAEQHIADRTIVRIFPKETRPLVWLNVDSLVGFDRRTPRRGMMLRLAPWFYPVAVRDEALIQS